MRAASPIAERPISQTGILFCHKFFSFSIWLVENIELYGKLLHLSGVLSTNKLHFSMNNFILTLSHNCLLACTNIMLKIVACFSYFVFCSTTIESSFAQFSIHKFFF